MKFETGVFPALSGYTNESATSTIVKGSNACAHWFYRAALPRPFLSWLHCAVATRARHRVSIHTVVLQFRRSGGGFPHGNRAESPALVCRVVVLLPFALQLNHGVAAGARQRVFLHTVVLFRKIATFGLLFCGSGAEEVGAVSQSGTGVS